MKKIVSAVLLGITVTGLSLATAGSAQARQADFSQVYACVRTTAEFSDGTLGVYCSDA